MPAAEPTVSPAFVDTNATLGRWPFRRCPLDEPPALAAQLRAHLLKQLPAERLLFGSHTPLLYFESAALKLKESVLTAAQFDALRSGNARRLHG